MSECDKIEYMMKSNGRRPAKEQLTEATHTKSRQVNTFGPIDKEITVSPMAWYGTCD